MSYVVSQRTHEIGIHMALGANSGDVLRSVALWGLKPVAAGMIVGLGCGAAASALLHSTLASPASSDFLYGVQFYDPWTFAGISIFLVSVSLLASLVPAVRAVGSIRWSPCGASSRLEGRGANLKVETGFHSSAPALNASVRTGESAVGMTDAGDSTQ